MRDGKNQSSLCINHYYKGSQATSYPREVGQESSCVNHYYKGSTAPTGVYQPTAPTGVYQPTAPTGVYQPTAPTGAYQSTAPTGVCHGHGHGQQFPSPRCTHKLMSGDSKSDVEMEKLIRLGLYERDGVPVPRNHRSTKAKLKSDLCKLIRESSDDDLFSDIETVVSEDIFREELRMERDLAKLKKVEQRERIRLERQQQQAKVQRARDGIRDQINGMKREREAQKAIYNYQKSLGNTAMARGKVATQQFLGDAMDHAAATARDTADGGRSDITGPTEKLNFNIYDGPSASNNPYLKGISGGHNSPYDPIPKVSFGGEQHLLPSMGNGSGRRQRKRRRKRKV